MPLSTNFSYPECLCWQSSLTHNALVDKVLLPRMPLLTKFCYPECPCCQSSVNQVPLLTKYCYPSALVDKVLLPIMLLLTKFCDPACSCCQSFITQNALADKVLLPRMPLLTKFSYPECPCWQSVWGWSIRAGRSVWACLTAAHVVDTADPSTPGMSGSHSSSNGDPARTWKKKAKCISYLTKLIVLTPIVFHLSASLS